MQVLQRYRETVTRALRVFVTFSLLLTAACGSDDSNVPASENLTAAQIESLGIQVSPAITPSFDPDIHDYVINCTTASEVQFSASLHGGYAFGFFGPGERAGALSAFPIGSYQRSFSMAAGQRFQFAVGSAATEYSVRCLPADFPPLTATTSGTREAQFYLFTPTLYLTAPTTKNFYAIITDSNGTPIWWDNDTGGSPIDAKVLGPDQIMWSISIGQVGSGGYVIRNFAGQVLNKIGPGLNPHDLQPTVNGTFIGIHDVPRVCPPDCADMSPWGGSAAMSVLDQEILEMDANSNILWTWRTRDHIGLNETGDTGWFPGVGNDIIHMNSVDPEGTTALKFTARHLNAIYHITKSTGAIDWKVGGVTTPQSFVVVGDTRPTAIGVNGKPLSGMHDGRLWPDGTVSVHDNGTQLNRPPAVVRYQIDTSARTATVVEQFNDLIDPSSICCGSARRLSNGHWLVEWGSKPYMTEVDAQGNTYLTVNYNIGAQFSYRAVPILPGVVEEDTLRNGMDAMPGQ